jgi:uncharacterized protein
MSPTCTVIVFAKAPVAGYAKTRLIAALGARGAALLAERLLQRTVEAAVAAGIGPVELCCTPSTDHPAFAAWAGTGRVRLSVQGDGDLGARMLRAFERVLARPGCAIGIGIDAPALDARYLREAARRLDSSEVVLGPALDGGYTLIGLRQPIAALFEDIPWSTGAVLESTRDRLKHLALPHAELAPLGDIDEPADLHQLPAAWLPLMVQP